MKGTRNALFVANTLALALTQLPAQSVLQVGPGNFLSVQAAVDAAVEDDVIRIAPGSYASFQCPKGLRFIADVARQVAITGDITLSLNNTQYAELAGIDATSMQVQGGTVSVEDCTTTTDSVFQSSVVIARHCNFLGTLNALEVQGGYLAASDTRFESLTAQPGLLLSAGLLIDGIVELSNCMLAGGSTMSANPSSQYQPSPALVVAPGSTSQVWLVDCGLRGGNAANGLPGASAIRSPISIRTHRSTLVGGVGSMGSAPPVNGPATIPGPLLGVSSNATTLEPGGSLVVDYQAEPNDVILQFATFRIGRPVPLSVLEQPLLQGSPMTVAFFVADAQGQYQWIVNVPNDPGLRNLAIWSRGVNVSRSPFQGTTVVGGVVR